MTKFVAFFGALAMAAGLAVAPATAAPGGMMMGDHHRCMRGTHWIPAHRDRRGHWVKAHCGR